MLRLYLFSGFVIALISAGAGLVYSCKSALDNAYIHGQSDGRAEVQAQVQQAIHAEQAAAATLAQQASVKLTHMEEERAHVQAQLDHAIAVAQRSHLGATSCFDARIVHALNRIGRSPARTDPDTRPSSARL